MPLTTHIPAPGSHGAPRSLGSSRRAGTRCLVVVLAGCALLAGCGKDATAPRTHALSGHVRLAGVERDAVGQETGTRTITNADSVQVQLLQNGVVVASTRTIGGGYQFTELQDGSYRVVARVQGTIADTSAALSISGDNLAVSELLELGHSGALVATPNPFTAAVQFRFSMAAAGEASLRVTSLGGTGLAQLVLGSLGAGEHLAEWSGLDDGGHALATGTYWVVFNQGNDWRADLIFK